MLVAAALLLALAALVAAPRPVHAFLHRFRASGEHLVARLARSPASPRVTGALALAALPVAVSAAGPVPPTRIGMNIGVPYFWQGRLYANLAAGTSWTWMAPGQPPRELRPDELGPDRSPLRTPQDGRVMRPIATPTTGPAGARLRCTFDGSGEMSVEGNNVRNLVRSPGMATFRFTSDSSSQALIITLSRIDPARPPRNFDCREADLDPKARFAPEAIERFKGYKALRFMDLQQANGNAPVTWATRNTPQTLDVALKDGIAIEDMVELANLTGADPWMIVPWNADADYVARFARYVHDHLAPDRVAYVELGNEIWNSSFKASQQAQAEGVARHLSPDPGTALSYRYAQRVAEVMRVWTAAFADKPSRLVRIASSHAALPAMADAILGYRDTARYVDALATAPYFGYQASSWGTRDPDQIFQRLRGTVDQAIGYALQMKAVARKYGKRYIAYEAGSHIVFGDDVPLMQKLHRDARMYDVYRYYLGQWRAKVGDLIMLFTSVGQIGWYGAFGLQEYEHQPIEQTPRLRAVKDELAH